MKKTMMVICCLSLFGCANFGEQIQSFTSDPVGFTSGKFAKVEDPTKVESYLKDTGSLDKEILKATDQLAGCETDLKGFKDAPAGSQNAKTDVNSLLKMAGLTSSTSRKNAFTKYQTIGTCHSIFDMADEDVNKAISDFYQAKRADFVTQCEFNRSNSNCMTYRDDKRSVEDKAEEFGLAYLQREKAKNSEIWKRASWMGAVLPNLDNFMSIVGDYYKKQEITLIKQKYGGKVPCANGLNQAVFYNIAPSSNCIYVIDTGLQVLSSTSQGAIYMADSGNPVFIYESNKLADGARIQPGYITYAGLFNYTSVIGSNKNIYAFRRINADFSDYYFVFSEF